MTRFAQISNTLRIPLPGYGAMGLSYAYGLSNEEEAQKVLRHAIDIGCVFWNTATVYGPDQHNEKLLGKVLREGDNSSKVFITTKWGFAPDRKTDGSLEYGRRSIDQSIINLGRTPDAWLLHRVDIDTPTPVETSVAVMQEAREAGKCKFIGLSAVSANTLRRAAMVAKIDFVEMEFSPFETSIETNGVLEACKELGVRVIAYMPLGSGFLTGRFRSYEDFQKEGDMRGLGMFPRLGKELFDHNFKLVAAFEALAKKKGCTAGQLCLAWAMQVHGDLILPIPGTKSIKYLDENWASREVELADDEMASIRELIERNPVKGEQIAPAFLKYLNA